MQVEELFAMILTLCAGAPTEEHKAWAGKVWHEGVILTDMHPREMNIDRKLETLGLAREDADGNWTYKGLDY
jgi:hypothetical protein